MRFSDMSVTDWASVLRLAIRALFFVLSLLERQEE